MDILPVLLIAFFLIGLVVTIWATLIYNRYTRLRHLALEAWDRTNTQLKARYEQVPELIKIVGPHTSHEKELLTHIIQSCETGQAFAQATEKSPQENRIHFDQNFKELLRQLLSISENYADLKTNSRYIDLYRNLVETENAIQIAQHNYNNRASTYNAAIATFPDALIAKISKLHRLPSFTLNTPKNSRY